jgi:hypothetical protein
MNRAIRSLLPLLVAAATVSGCTDSTGPTPDSGPRSGSASFGFNGDLGPGTFTASGAPKLNSQGQISQWASFAIGARTTAPASLMVAGFRQINGSRGDFIFIYLPNVTGPAQSIPFCEEANCAFAMVFFNSDLADEEDIGDRMCFVTEGSASLPTFNSADAKGSFSGSGVCFPAELEDEEDIEEFAITTGSFDVAVHDNLDID